MLRGADFGYNLPMPELPISPETPPSLNNSETTAPNERPAVIEPIKLEVNSSEAPKEIATPLPPILQPDSEGSIGSTTVAPTAAPTGLVHKGARVSGLTNVALRTFAALQRKLAAHYQKLREKVGVSR